MIQVLLDNDLIEALEGTHLKNASTTIDLIEKIGYGTFDEITEALWNLAALGLICGCRCSKSNIAKDMWWALSIKTSMNAELRNVKNSSYMQVCNGLDSNNDSSN